MYAQEVQEKTKSRKKALKKTGVILYVFAAVFFGICVITAASGIGGLITGFSGIFFIVCLVLGLIFRIAGSGGKN